MSQKSYEQLTGLYGVITILIAYALVSFSIFLPAHPLIVFLNISGALGLILENLRQKDWPVVTLNTIWMLIAVITLVRGLLS